MLQTFSNFFKPVVKEKVYKNNFNIHTQTLLNYQYANYCDFAVDKNALSTGFKDSLSKTFKEKDLNHLSSGYLNSKNEYAGYLNYRLFLTQRFSLNCYPFLNLDEQKNRYFDLVRKYLNSFGISIHFDYTTNATGRLGLGITYLVNNSYINRIEVGLNSVIINRFKTNFNESYAALTPHLSTLNNNRRQLQASQIQPSQTKTSKSGATILTTGDDNVTQQSNNNNNAANAVSTPAELDYPNKIYLFEELIGIDNFEKGYNPALKPDGDKYNPISETEYTTLIDQIKADDSINESIKALVKDRNFFKRTLNSLRRVFYIQIVSQTLMIYNKLGMNLNIIISGAAISLGFNVTLLNTLLF